MNKNQKHLPYTYSQLILTNRMMAGYHRGIVNRLENELRKLRNQGVHPTENREKLNYHQEQLRQLDEEHSRYSIARSCCGDGTVIIR